LKRLIYSILRPVHKPVARLTRGMTLGARVVALRDDEVMLVKQSYAPGWILPGGGVERGETLHEAAIREAREEAGLIAEGPLQLHGIFANEAKFRGDHVACFVMREFSVADWVPDAEITDARFFAKSGLPEDTTGGSLRRLAEIFDGVPVAQHW
jgi:8-oxo-dGTP pyrophosphatase MutT (NUDIX family)